MDDKQKTIFHFEDLLRITKDPKQQARLLSTVYNKETTREQLRKLIFEVATANGFDQSSLNINSILNTAYTPERLEEHLDQEEETRQKRQNNTPSSNGFQVIDHHKYEDDILDNLAKKQQHDAVNALDKIRNDSSLTDAQRQEQLAAKFKEVLTKNATLEGSIDQQATLLRDQVGNRENGIPFKEGEIAAADRIEMRAKELVKQRAAEREELPKLREELQKIKESELLFKVIEHPDTLSKDEQAKLSQFDKLSDEEQKKIQRYRDLREKLAHEKKTDIPNIEGLTARFSKLKKDEQDALMRRLLSRQQRRTRSEMWKILNKDERTKFLGWQKKTLSRAERKKLVNFQNKQFSSPSQVPSASALRRIFDRLFADLSRYEEIDEQYVKNEFPSYQSERNSGGGGGGSNIVDKYNQARKLYNNGKRAMDFLKGLGQGGEAVEGAGSLGSGLAAAAPYIAIGLGILLLIFILFYLIYLSTLGSGGGFSDQLIQLQCGDMQDISTQDNAPQVQTAFARRFGVPQYPIIAPQADTQNVGPESVTVKQEERMYSVVCALFGHVVGTPYQNPDTPSTFNTFGSLIIGTAQDRKDILSGKNKFASFELLMRVDTDGSKSCVIEFQKIDGAGNPTPKYKWFFYHPEQCSDSKFQFLIAQWLGHTLILQQDHLAQQKQKSSNVYKLFKTTPDAAGIMGEDGILPTRMCQSGDDYGDHANDQQNRNCFADMVGAYLTYNDYDNASDSAALTSSPLKDFPFGKYKDYFWFANMHLFDGLIFYVTPDAGIPADVSRLDDFSSAVMGCQGANGREHTPTLACRKQGMSLWSGKDENYVNAYRYVGPNYQCGAFVWSYEALYGWSRLRGNGSGGVSGWYWYGPTKQKGYTWFENPYHHGGTSANIQPGDIIVYATDRVNSGDVGHVAVVKSVEKDHFHITVYESNYYEDASHRGMVSNYRKLTLNQFIRSNAIQGWWRSDTLKSVTPTPKK